MIFIGWKTEWSSSI